MGNNQVLPQVTKAPYNADDRIDDPKEFPNACVSNLGDDHGKAVMQNFYPDGDEYEWAGMGNDCGYVTTREPQRMKDNSGCDKSGNCATIGKIPKYKRTSYKGNTKKCCITGLSTLDGVTCNPSYRDKNRFTNDTCIPHLESNCSDLAKYSDTTCSTWFSNYHQSFPTQAKICAGAPTRTNENCYNWCNGIRSDSASAKYYAQCQLDKWQQGYCSKEERALETSGVCADYCDSSNNNLSLSDRTWCTNQRQLLCSKKLTLLKDQIDALIQSGASTTIVQSYQDQMKKVINGPCACYLPQTFYDEYILSLIESMGLKRGKDDVLINYLRANNKCIYPPCAQNENQSFQPYKCPPLNICSQNIDIKVNGSSVKGAISANASQQCAVELENSSTSNTETNKPDTKTSTTEEDTTTEEDNTPTPDEEIENSKKITLIYIIIGSVIFFILILIIIILIVRGKKTK